MNDADLNKIMENRGGMDESQSKLITPNHRKRRMKKVIALIGTYLVLWLGCVIAIIWVIAHFIRKLW